MTLLEERLIETNTGDDGPDHEQAPKVAYDGPSLYPREYFRGAPVYAGRSADGTFQRTAGVEALAAYASTLKADDTPEGAKLETTVRDRNWQDRDPAEVRSARRFYQEQLARAAMVADVTVASEATL